MSGMGLVGSKVILAIANFFLLGCGFTLITGGILILFDSDRILLSKLLAEGPFADLTQPYLHYIAIGLTLLGLTLATAGILGCWASCLHNYWLLSFYFIIVMIVLICECSIYIVAWLWPQCMGLGLDSDILVKRIQGKYGIENEDQFTAAIDLAQTTFNCCGINSADEYDTSLWRLQGKGYPLAVPLSCCILKNRNEDKSYLNPIPNNSSLCQALELTTHEGYRHTIGCQARLEQWYKEHYIAFLAIGFAVVLVEFIVLLSSVLTCTRIYHRNQEKRENKLQNHADNEEAASNKDYAFQKRNSAENSAFSNETYAMTDSFKQNYKLLDKP